MANVALMKTLVTRIRRELVTAFPWAKAACLPGSGADRNNFLRVRLPTKSTLGYFFGPHCEIMWAGAALSDPSKYGEKGPNMLSAPELRTDDDINCGGHEDKIKQVVQFFSKRMELVARTPRVHGGAYLFKSSLDGKALLIHVGISLGKHTSNVLHVSAELLESEQALKGALRRQRATFGSFPEWLSATK